MKISHKRFIAGAHCPACQAIDKIFVYREGDRNIRECVSCGFREAQAFDALSREPETRVTRDHGLNEPQVLRLVDPDAESSSGSD
ncbi:MAG TPA: hypothetical protein DCF62_06275 [Porticoccaceae bacterium]|nr:hypothetical protein [Porticoccaceae bacterium]